MSVLKLKDTRKPTAQSRAASETLPRPTSPRSQPTERRLWWEGCSVAAAETSPRQQLRTEESNVLGDWFLRMEGRQGLLLVNSQDLQSSKLLICVSALTWKSHFKNLLLAQKINEFSSWIIGTICNYLVKCQNTSAALLIQTRQRGSQRTHLAWIKLMGKKWLS